MCMVHGKTALAWIREYMAMLWLPFLGTHALLLRVCSAVRASTD